MPEELEFRNCEGGKHHDYVCLFWLCRTSISILPNELEKQTSLNSWITTERRLDPTDLLSQWSVGQLLLLLLLVICWWIHHSTDDIILSTFRRRTRCCCCCLLLHIRWVLIITLVINKVAGNMRPQSSMLSVNNNDIVKNATAKRL